MQNKTEPFWTAIEREEMLPANPADTCKEDKAAPCWRCGKEVWALTHIIGRPNYIGTRDGGTLQSVPLSYVCDDCLGVLCVQQKD